MKNRNADMSSRLFSPFTKNEKADSVHIVRFSGNANFLCPSRLSRSSRFARGQSGAESFLTAGIIAGILLSASLTCGIAPAFADEEPSLVTAEKSLVAAPAPSRSEGAPSTNETTLAQTETSFDEAMSSLGQAVSKASASAHSSLETANSAAASASDAASAAASAASEVLDSIARPPAIAYDPPARDGVLTIDDILACKSRREVVDLLLPVYAYYCKAYGLKYPGIFAVQTIYETLGNIGTSTPVADCAKVDNNLGGLKWAHQDKATKGIVTSEGDNYAHFETVEDYIACATKYVGTSRMHAESRASQGTVRLFTDVYFRTWLLGDENEDVRPYYYEKVLEDYQTYGLSRYEL